MNDSYLPMGLVCFAFFWFTSWAMQIVSARLKNLSGTIQVKWYVRLLLGLKPIDGPVVLRPAIVQFWALLFSGMGVVMNFFMVFGKTEVLMWVFVFILTLGTIGALLNKKQLRR